MIDNASLTVFASRNLNSTTRARQERFIALFSTPQGPFPGQFGAVTQHVDSISGGGLLHRAGVSLEAAKTGRF